MCDYEQRLKAAKEVILDADYILIGGGSGLSAACIKKAGMYCAIMTTVSCVNADEIPELIDIVVEHKADVFAFGRYCPTSEQTIEEYHIEPLVYKAFLEKVWDKFMQHKGCATTFQLKDHLWTLFLYDKGMFKLPEGMDDDVIYDGCHCGSGHMTILPTGDVYACRRMESTHSLGVGSAACFAV